MAWLKWVCTRGWSALAGIAQHTLPFLWDAEPWCLHHQPSVRLLNKPLKTTNTDLHRTVNSIQAYSHGLQMSIFVCFYLQNWTRDKGSSTCLCPEGSSVPLLLASMVYAHFLLHVSQQQANQAPAGLLSEEILIWSTNAWNSCSANWCAECAQELINMSETKSAQWLLEKKKKNWGFWWGCIQIFKWMDLETFQELLKAPWSTTSCGLQPFQ